MKTRSPRHPFTGRTFPVAAGLSFLALAACSTPSPSSQLETSSLPPAATTALAEAQANFTVGGEPIHPALIHLFDGYASDDGPVIVAVDVHEAHHSNQFSAPVFRDGPDVYCDLPDTTPPENYHYRRLGVLADGTQVLETSWNGGGSGDFESLLLLRFQLEPYRRPEGQRDWRLVLREIEDLPLGDRDDGVITVESTRVIIGPSRYRIHSIIVTPDI